MSLGPKFSKFAWPPATQNSKLSGLAELGADFFDFAWPPAEVFAFSNARLVDQIGFYGK